MAGLRTIELPADLCAEAEKKFGQAFGSVQELLVSVLHELLRNDALAADQAEQRLVEERLRELGYL